MANVPSQAQAGHTRRAKAVEELQAAPALEDADDRGRLAGKALLSAKEAAQYLSMTVQMFRDLVAEGIALMPALERGRTKRWSRLELLSWSAHDCPPERRWTAQWKLMRESVITRGA